MKGISILLYTKMKDGRILRHSINRKHPKATTQSMSFSLNFMPTAAVFFVLMIFALPTFKAQGQEAEPTDCELSLSFTPAEQAGRLTGTATIKILAGRRLNLSFPQMKVTGALLQEENGLASELPEIHDGLILPAANTARTLIIYYNKTVTGNGDNIISPAGIALTSNWHPLSDQPMRFRITATLPDNFSAITESDTFPLTRRGKTVNTVFAKPLEAVHFIAGPYTIHKRRVRENLFVYSMFFAEDTDLADGYLQAAAEYLKRYEREIGPYPYNHYVIVANRLPTGLGMPTFTLLGQTVLRLPFIKATSLGHEIVHSWFGNSVAVDYNGGNWCEGLTAFLSDHAFREEKGEGVADRTESITRYLSYVSKNIALSLQSFSSANHNQAMAEAKRAIGYNRGALLFHELREKLGSRPFNEGLRLFYAKYRDRKASWHDLQQSFSTAAKSDLESFFKERLERTDIPDLAIENIAVTSNSNGSTLNFTLRQKTAKPYTLLVPIRIKTQEGQITVRQEISELATPLAISLARRPLEFTIDPDHDLLRQLTPEEFPAVWSRLLGADSILAIVKDENEQQIYQPLLDSLKSAGLTLTTADKVSNQELSANNLLFLGSDQLPARSLFGPPPPVGPGLILDVRRNPLSPEHVAVLVTSGDHETARAVIGRLSHYGKYSYLKFSGGRNTEKRIQPVESGLRVVLEDLPRGGDTSQLSSFDQVIEKLAETRVIYIGETHTTYADHLLQLRIIEALHKKNPLLAIGMEMFPTSSQPALDRYTLGKGTLTERDFLKESKYFKVWRYDYRYFREIFNFAKESAIPVVGLNLDGHIVSEVFRSGGTDSLSPEIRANLPPDRDLDMPGYRERLAEIHEMHMAGKHGRGLAGGFLQAQALWDETMAENISDYLAAHPDHKMVVLAGTEHTRKDTGIPPRVARRLPVRQASVLNLYGNSDPQDLAMVADYFFLATEQNLAETPKIGVILDADSKDGRSFLKISQINPHGKAEAAGLRVGDRIQEINNMAVADMADLHIAMLDTEKGDIIGVKIGRNEHDEERDLQFHVELTVPPVSPPHP